MPFEFSGPTVVHVPRGEYASSLYVTFSGGAAPPEETLDWIIKQDEVTIASALEISWIPPRLYLPIPIPTSADLGLATVEVTPSSAGSMFSKDIIVTNSPPKNSLTGSGYFENPPAEIEIQIEEEVDLDSTITSRYWKIYGPSGSSDVIEDESPLETTLSDYGNYYIQLVTVDSDGSMCVAQHEIRLNQVPTAVISPASGTINAGVPVTISGADSADDEEWPEGAFFWTILSGPGVPLGGINAGETGGSAEILGDYPENAAAEVDMQFNVAGNFVVRLIVFDSDGAASDPVTRTFTIVA